MDRYGLIAGNGSFPLLVLEAARQQGIEMIVAAIKEEASPEVERLSDRVYWMSVGELGKLIDAFKKAGVNRAIMAGQVKHIQIFQLFARPDWKMFKLLKNLKQKNTNALIGAVVESLAREGITVVDSTAFLKPLIAPAGVLTARAPSRQELEEIRYGLEVARQIARLDLGQTVVVKDKAIVAIEAMEGTDAAIMRAAELVKGKRITVVKVARPNQDMRFDVPVVGLKTIRTMVEANATALSIDAGRTLLFEKAEMLRLADQAGIAIVAQE